ncbi:MAG: pyruvate carboxyltransferase, partial [Candidatus Bathyarchaeia archaeon]
MVVHDNTLRDGEQQAGVVFSKQEKLHIAHALNEVGIDRIEVGMPVVSKDDFEVMKTLASEDLNSKLYCLARATKEDVDAATECGAYGLVMEIPSSKHIHEALGWTKEEAISKLVTATQHAVDRGLHVGVFPWDTTRADLSDYLDIAKAAADAHADSIAVVDTFGVAVPNVVKHLIKKLKATVKVPVEIHCHNDFGL